MLLASIWIQIGIIGGIVVIFLLSCFLNWKTKAPKGVDVPERCMSCESKTCMIKSTDVEKIKNEMKEYINNCEEKDDE